MSLRSDILLVLQEGEAHGVEIRRRIHGRRGYVWISFYPELRKLEREGVLTTRQGEPLAVRGGRPRTYYRLAS